MNEIKHFAIDLFTTVFLGGLTMFALVLIALGIIAVCKDIREALTRK